uniref:NADH-ubiquinone oxidoreductase chain 2 n=2 Tax=Acestrorhamphidae TaxID=3391093 RepID=A0A890A136_9TELE|nr:NADH dehydrogenase subunit 2 [Inpaichthys kerri]QQW50119.1 NADH dehydrogenase subunit 2 [Inpaichthys kerri]
MTMHAFVKYVLIFSLGSGTVLTFLSSHWIISLAGIEISTLAILPLMAQHNHPRALEAATKYFLIQACATSTLLIATSLNAWMEGQWNILEIKNNISTVLVITALSLKLGLAPFHFWLPEVMQGLDLTTGLILSTWQKLAPFALLIQTSYTSHPELLTLLGLVSAGWAGWAGMNQTQLRKILAYSSTAHLGWMIIIIQYSPNFSILALSIYIIMTTAAFFTLKESASTKISTISLSWSKNPTPMITMTLVLLSLAGLPPLTGFSPKWMILEEMTKQEMTTAATLIVMSALISLFFYTRLCYFLIITIFPNSTKTKLSWRLMTKKNKITMSTFTATALTLLPVTPMILSTTYLYGF